MSEPSAFTVLIDAPRADVWAALTEGEALCAWFAEHADVDLDAKTYAFWGRYTIGTSEAGAQRLLEVQPAQRLSFAWTIGERETTCTWALTEEGGSTRVTVSQADAVSTDFWLIALMNLRSFVEEGAPMRRVEPSSGARERIEVVQDIDASPAEVFALFTDGAQLERWIAAKGSIDPVAGGAMDIGWEGFGPMKILDLVPDERIAWRWTEAADHPETVVTWTLEGSGGTTRLTMVHSGFAPDKGIEGLDMGWTMFAMRIKDLAEHGPARRIAKQIEGAAVPWEAAG